MNKKVDTSLAKTDLIYEDFNNGSCELISDKEKLLTNLETQIPFIVVQKINGKYYLKQGNYHLDKGIKIIDFLPLFTGFITYLAPILDRVWFVSFVREFDISSAKYLSYCLNENLEIDSYNTNIHNKEFLHKKFYVKSPNEFVVIKKNKRFEFEYDKSNKELILK